MDEISIFNSINSVFDKYTTPWNTLDKAVASKEFSNEVLIEIDKIYEYVSRYYVDWKIDTMETVLERLEKDIRFSFPYLNNKAIRILKNYFTYEWK